MSYSFVRRIAIAAATLPLLLAGCTDDDPVPQIPDPTTPSPTTSETTAAPEPWEEQTEDGAIAFAEHWIDLLNNARLDYDIEPFAAANATACRTCSNMVELFEVWQADGTAYESEPWRIEQVATIAAEPTETRLGLRVNRPKEQVTDPNGRVTMNPRSQVTYAATVTWSKNSWRMHELVIIQ